MLESDFEDMFNRLEDLKTIMNNPIAIATEKQTKSKAIVGIILNEFNSEIWYSTGNKFELVWE